MHPDFRRAQLGAGIAANASLRRLVESTLDRAPA